MANRQQVIDNQMLDDGIFDTTGFTTATLLSGGGGCLGTSLDLTGTGSYSYACGGGPVSDYANAIDNKWFQSGGTVGSTVFDLGFNATKAAVFNSIDHGPLPGESIESTVYLSNDKVSWTQAVVERVWLEGFMANTDILWDGFVYAVGTGTTDTFRYASVIHGGPGSLRDDGDDEINGLMGLKADFTGNPTDIPEPASLALMGLGLAGLGFSRRRRKTV
ncbi:MAG TPA: PEP-CTERM sorting domain-containing protein [Gammaproteobacteria bacterium]|nr:PEP-CTERM sorting domain-containing protein [Gammaproteobacteria bacterium]